MERSLLPMCGGNVDVGARYVLPMMPSSRQGTWTNQRCGDRGEVGKGFAEQPLHSATAFSPAILWDQRVQVHRAAHVLRLRSLPRILGDEQGTSSWRVLWDPL
jgi:hypothetical protein